MIPSGASDEPSDDDPLEPVTADLNALFASIEHRHAQPRLPGVPRKWGRTALDAPPRIESGRGEVTLICGEPGVGKSSLLSAVIRHVACRGRDPV